jgi:hypothetical protein
VTTATPQPIRITTQTALVALGSIVSLLAFTASPAHAQGASGASGTASGAAGPGVVKWEAGPGVSLSLTPPHPSTLLHDKALPEVDLSSFPGAKLALRRGVSHAGGGSEHGSDSLKAVCVRAPGANLTSEMRLIAFEKLTDAVRAEEGKGSAQVESLDTADIRDEGFLSVQPFSGRVSPASGDPAKQHRTFEGKHIIGFIGDGPEAVACVVLCSELSADGARVCPGLVAGASLDAAWVTPPGHGLLGRLGRASQRRPIPALGLITGVGLVLAGLVLAAWSARPAARHSAPP